MVQASHAPVVGQHSIGPHPGARTQATQRPAEAAPRTQDLSHTFTKSSEGLQIPVLKAKKPRTTCDPASSDFEPSWASGTRALKDEKLPRCICNLLPLTSKVKQFVELPLSDLSVFVMIVVTAMMIRGYTIYDIRHTARNGHSKQLRHSENSTSVDPKQPQSVLQRNLYICNQKFICQSPLNKRKKRQEGRQTQEPQPEPGEPEIMIEQNPFPDKKGKGTTPGTPAEPGRTRKSRWNKTMMETHPFPEEEKEKKNRETSPGTLARISRN